MAKKKMTAAALNRKVNAYFSSIRAERTLLRKTPITELGNDGKLHPRIDAYGHELCCYEPVITADGKEAKEIYWVEPPSIIGLSLYLSVDRTTLFRWKNLRENKEELTDEEEKICNILTRAWGRIEEYLVKQTENPKAARGATANLEANFGWKRKKEVGFDDRTAQVVATATMSAEEKLAALKELGLKIPWDETANEEGTDDDD